MTFIDKRHSLEVWFHILWEGNLTEWLIPRKPRRLVQVCLEICFGTILLVVSERISDSLSSENVSFADGNIVFLN